MKYGYTACFVCGTEQPVEQLYKIVWKVLFVDKESKKVLTRFYGVDDPEVYKDSTEKLLLGMEVADRKAHKRDYILSKPSAERAKKAKLYV